MSGKSSNAKRQAQKREDQMFNRILVAFGIAIVLEVIFVMIYRYYYRGNTQPNTAALVLGLIALAAAAACGLTFLTAHGRAHHAKALGVGVLVSLGAAAAFLLMYRFGTFAASFCCIICPLVVGLYLVYTVYPREFFLLAIGAGGSIVALWLVRRYWETVPYRSYLLLGLLALALILILLGTWLAGRHKGVLHLGRLRLRVYATKGGRIPLAVTLGVALLLTVLTLILGPQVAYVGQLILGGLIFIAAVYFTVKLM